MDREVSLLLLFFLVIKFLPKEFQDWSRELRTQGKDTKVILLSWQDEQTFLVYLALRNFLGYGNFNGKIGKTASKLGWLVIELS